MHKFISSIDVATRMLVVSSFLVIMPCWAAFWSHNRGEEGEPRDVAKIVSHPVSASQPAGASCDKVGHDGIGRPTAVRPESRGAHQESVARSTSQPDPALLGLQERLQKLGVGYMLLERYPDPQRGVAGSYHFVCRIPIPVNPLYERTFESVDGDAVAAMQQVVEEVELWQATHAGVRKTR